MSPTTTVPARLAPGVHVVARDDDHVQVGLDPPARLLVRRHPELLARLDDLVHGRPARTESAATTALVAALDAAGLLLTTPPAADRPTRADTVHLVDEGLGLTPLADRLEAAGVATTPVAVPDLYVLASPGPVPRSRLDAWLCEGAPHLVVSGTGVPGSLRVGPLVEPGTTACLRCVDAAEATHDTRRTLVLEQLAALPARPLDPAVVGLALAWAARDVTTWLAGERPATWSGSVDLGGLAPVVRAWERHPHCGCAWDVLPY